MNFMNWEDYFHSTSFSFFTFSLYIFWFKILSCPGELWQTFTSLYSFFNHWNVGLPREGRLMAGQSKLWKRDSCDNHLGTKHSHPLDPILAKPTAEFSFWSYFYFKLFTFQLENHKINYSKPELQVEKCQVARGGLHYNPSLIPPSSRRKDVNILSMYSHVTFLTTPGQRHQHPLLPDFR